jgi:Tfp pilus assembly protein PilN
MGTPHPSASTAPPASRTSFTFKAGFFLVPLVISMAMIGIFTEKNIRSISLIDQQLAKEREREKYLAAIAPQNAEYQRRLSHLAANVDTIQTLQRIRVGPVELMRSLGKVLTQSTDVDINSVFPQNGRLAFRGRSHSVESTGRFLTFLASYKGFSDVQVKKFYQDYGPKSPTYHFELDCAYSPPSTEGSTP